MVALRWLVAVTFLTGLPGSGSSGVIHVPGDEPSIYAGIDAASEGDTVLVACGVYYEHDIEMKPGVCLRSETGQPDCVTIDARHQGQILRCSHADSSTAICGFTITNGVVIWGDRGGGLECSNSSPRISNVVFAHNTASIGGAVSCYESSPTITGASFIGNVAESGGAMWCWGSSSPTITDAVFSGNIAYAGHGGAMSCDWWTSPVLTNVEFIDNWAARDGGAVELTRTSAPRFDSVLFAGNSASDGGALYCYQTSPALTDCVFYGNSAYRGGGVFCAGSGAPTLTGCILSNNAANKGGGIACYTQSSPALDHVTLFQNSADGEGGGIYVHSLTSVTLVNTIVAFGGAGEAVRCLEGGNAVLSCCDLHGNAGGDWEGCVASQYGSEGNISLDPMFCESSNPDEPLALYSDSPCAAGNNPGCGQVGALGVGCQGPSVARVSWGRIKSIYR